MRIGIDITPLQTGHKFRGIGEYTFNLVKNLSAIDKENQYFLFGLKNVVCDLPRQPNFELVNINHPKFGRLSSIVSHQFFLLPILECKKLDLFHFLGITADPSAPGLPFIHTCRTIVTVHDMTLYRFRQVYLNKVHKRFFYKVMLSAVKKAEHIITASNSTKSDITNFIRIDPCKISVIPDAPSLVWQKKMTKFNLSHIKKLGIDENIILNVGATDFTKNTSGLIEAYHLLISQTNLKHQLVIVGVKGFRTFPPLAKKIRNLGLIDKVIFTDYLPGEDLEALYSIAKVFVFPSFCEGFGMPPLEAMSFGVPVITSNRGSLPEVLNGAALLVDPYNIEEMAQAMRRLLTDGALRDKLVMLGKERVKCFSWEKTARETLKVYEKVAG